MPTPRTFSRRAEVGTVGQSSAVTEGRRWLIPTAP
jgi:hypothetical protein